MSKLIQSVNSISEVHKILGLEPPKHPLISVFLNCDFKDRLISLENKYTFDLYTIGLKDGVTGSFGYGRNSYDFQDGTLIFMAPKQVFIPREIEIEGDPRSWVLMFHPDLIRSSRLGQVIQKEYSFFEYDVNEALHLSAKEIETISQIVYQIQEEYTHAIDKHTQDLMVMNIETLLKYCKRYFERQFYTRQNLNKDYIIQFENFISAYFQSAELLENGMPSVERCGQALNLSGHYLSDLLKTETGRSAKEHIHDYIVDSAKTKLLNTQLSVSQIAYELGFDYPQHFSKLFKSKTGQSPKEYRMAV